MFSEAGVIVMIENSPFWYRDGYDVCYFRIDRAAEGDEKGRFNRDLCAWGYEERYSLNEEGSYVLNE